MGGSLRMAPARSVTSKFTPLTSSEETMSAQAAILKPYTWRLRNGDSVTIRPIRAADAKLMVDFHKSLSDRTVYLRYFKNLKLSTRIAPERLARVCSPGDADEHVLVAERQPRSKDGPKIIAVARISRIADSNNAEVAVVVADAFQSMGLGSELLLRLVEIARVHGFQQLRASLLPENRAIRSFLKKQDLPVHYQVEDGILTIIIELLS